jgi:serine/threonine-protein kinase HipA
MNRCPITLDPCQEDSYSSRGLKLLSPRLAVLNDFPYTRAEQLEQAAQHASKMSIQGVQPKLSVKLNVPRGVFEIVNSGGTFIIKPPHAIYPEVVENEDLSMRLARACGIAVPLSGMIYAKDKSRSYFIKRFDRAARSRRVAVEDFAQLSEQTRDTKYDSSMEKVATVIETFCTFPAVEKVRLFRLTLFSFLIGNEDMHLKNFSLITHDGKTELSPAYDLINTTIILKTTDELALPLVGKKSGLKRQHFLDYFAVDRLSIPKTIAERELTHFANSFTRLKELVELSFLSERLKAEYWALVQKRAKAIGL